MPRYLCGLIANEMKHRPIHSVISAVNGITWPSLPNPQAAALLAMQYQLDESQWLSPPQLLAQQLTQLTALVRHARRTVPYYRQHLAGLGHDDDTCLSHESWQKIPFLRRDTVQQEAAALSTSGLPPGHGGTATIHTSGSTGKPVTIHKTELAQFFWMAITLRDHLWHQRDFSGKLAAIRPEGKLQPGKGVELQGWGPATDGIFRTGLSSVLTVRTPVDAQAAWLRDQNPAYLLSLPSNLAALAGYFLKRGWKLPRLAEVRAYGELLDDSVRQLCRQAWGVPVTDMYSAQEVGYIALQCPEAGRYHVQAESVLVEIVDAGGASCAPGEVGRLVLTPLHNFAMPLIRYLIGDYAAFGPPCPCGRGLPVLERIAGRQRNMLVLPDGRQHWPSFPAELWTPFSAIRQFQLVQQRLDAITVRLVAAPRLTPAEEERLANALRARFGYPFVIDFHYLERIERSSGGKFEDFISEIVSPVASVS